MMLSKICKTLQVSLALASCVALARADDWPQWRGATRNGISSESTWTTSWGSGPKRLWQASVGEGYSSVSVSKGKLYTMGNQGGRDTVFCLDANTGRIIWRQSYPCEGGDYSGPRCTPVVDGNRVYTLSREGFAMCFDAESGRIAWQKNIAQMAGAAPPGWGFTSSPLIEGNTVFYNISSAGVAADKTTGRILWKSAAGNSGYSSPVLFNAAGQRGIALFTEWGLVGVNPANGRPLWGFQWTTSYGVNAADPIFAGDSVFISSNYDKGCALLRLGGGQPAPVYQNRNMRNHFHTCILIGGYLYGNDQNNLKCIELRTGKQMWRTGGMGKGGLIAADNKLIALTERGELLVIAANPNQYQELARAKVLDGECWTHPVLANGRLYCRSHEGNLICLDLRKR
jgi:outer membrane protein assembly factor BamB